MFKNPYPGKFIVFEGIDGSGKSTQAGLLFHYLKERKKRVHSTSEPTQYLIGGLIKSWLAKDWQSTPDCLQLLFAADRAYHLDKEIIPLLKKGVTVVCDRYSLSTLAYGALELDLDWLITLNQNFIAPDVTFLLNTPPKICLERMQKERFFLNLFEEEKKLKKIWQNYQRLTKKYKNIYTINGEKSIEEVSKEIKKILKIKN
ncbi:MAG TPA: dTMP kinase [Candidatus Paceibacterota bacterium]|jgi:dTMP kinase|nr:dTMP kinase [Candidatus Pacearchaeota archaeon]HPZ74309.1 dTMP kinase [Candidatus Pacearchaeota archaeon]HQD89262.1 dTMP kinase [Candidatus Pacearchaeota archaeon]HRR39373.1 dTMP kinase [Candidatus Paceibacterota bacterium]